MNTLNSNGASLFSTQISPQFNPTKAVEIEEEKPEVVVPVKQK